MPVCALVLALVAASPPAVASDADLVQKPALALMSPMRWTRDGRFYAWTLLLDHEADSAFRGEVTLWEDDPSYELLVEVTTGKVRLLSDRELRHFYDQHPRDVGSPSIGAASEHLQASVQARGGVSRHPRWGDVCDALMLLRPSTEPMRCGMKSESGRIWTAHTFQQPAGMLESGVWMDVAPDDRRVIWVFHGRATRKSKQAGEARGFVDYVVTPVKAPSIQIAGDRPTTAEVLATIERLEKAGFAPTGTDYLAEAGEKTVVLARAGQEAAAKRVAAALGGAAVGPLPGRGRYDVVVVLRRGAGKGRSAGKARSIALRLVGPNPELASRGASATALQAQVAGALKGCGYVLDEKAAASLTVTVKGMPYAETAASRWAGELRVALALDGGGGKETLDEDVRLMAALSQDTAVELRATAAELLRAFCEKHGAGH